jgi:hypothetical protein
VVAVEVEEQLLQVVLQVMVMALMVVQDLL